MFDSRNEMIGWGVAIVVIAVMGLIVYGGSNNIGPFHKVNKPAAKVSFAPINVKIVDNPTTIGQYTPSTVHVHPGQKITWTNVSGVGHTVTSRADNGFDSGNIDTNGAKYTLPAPAKDGSYPYYCVYHPKMLGTIVVTG